MRAPILATLALLAAALPAAASAEFDPTQYRIESASVSLSSTQAGGHPNFTTEFTLSSKENQPYGFTRDVVVTLPPGMIGNADAFPKCTSLQLGAAPQHSECPQDSQVGSTDVVLSGPNAGTFGNEPIYDMQVTGGGEAARFGFMAGLFPVVLNARLDPKTDAVIASVEGASAGSFLLSSRTTFWGVPAEGSHDPERLTPEEVLNGTGPPNGRPSTLTGETPFLTNPTSCEAAQTVTITARSYQLPESPSSVTVPFPQITGCEALKFNPTVTAKPTTTQGTSGTGLDYEMSLPSKGIEFGNLYYDSELRRAEVTLPEGMTLNPSEAEGLGVCSEEDLARETYEAIPNQGCPESSKIGNAIAESPIVTLPAEGSLYLAKPYQNPFGSLIAVYLVLKIPQRGVLVKLAGEVKPDPTTGRIVTVFDDVPQLPVSSFSLHFREGARAPLVTPAACGTYQTTSDLTPWAAPGSVLFRPSPFQIESGPNHSPCPTGGTPPFHPGFTAGTENNAAGSFSPFYMRVSRQDEDQDLTKFSAKLPPGMVAKLAGTTQCSDAAIAQAASRQGPHGGEEEQASPSCPQSSQIGHVLAGAGVGSVLTYVEGKVYLAGPYHGAPLSVVAIVPAVAGPFDVGTVVTREALRIDPRSAEVEVDGSASDPIPHILAGIPLKVRDIRVYVDRPAFTLNPTSCDPFSTAATLWGGGQNVFSSLDDIPFGASDRFQAADCAALPFKPSLSLTLEGGTRRGAHPALTGAYQPRKGDANLKSLVLRLPHSAFLEQGHIRTICTRVQYAANGGNGGGCPPGSVYGHATAYTPILQEPLTGPVYLRSSDHNLPDFVAALHGLVDVEAVARIDSVHGGIRASFTNLPDAPLSKVVVHMQGAKKGLIVNSTDLCSSTHRASAAFEGQNGKSEQAKPVVKAAGCGKAKPKGHGRPRIGA